MSPFPITRNPAPKPKPADDNLTFGTVMTDHMFLMNYEEGKGWFDPRIVPYAPLSLDPATAVLHYGQAIFDGLKAFRGEDGTIRLFRADRHAQRFNRSAQIMCMPELPVDIIRQSFDALVAVDADWVPRKPGTSLYLRPTIIATDVMLGVHPARSLLYFLILSPVGSYYREGVKPVRILASDKHVRAVRGGTGEAKTAANYAQSLAGQRDAARAGYTQVLYLDALHRKYLEEVGTMNIMLRIDDEVITPPLAGTILDGVTRASAIQLLRDWGIKVSERPISIDEVMQAARDGRLREMWGTGTAAVVSPVGTLGYKGEDVIINGGQTGELTQRLYDAITGIQYGRTNDPYGWTSVVTPAAA